MIQIRQFQDNNDINCGTTYEFFFSLSFGVNNLFDSNYFIDGHDRKTSEKMKKKYQKKRKKSPENN